MAYKELEAKIKSINDQIKERQKMNLPESPFLNREWEDCAGRDMNHGDRRMSNDPLLHL